MMRSLYSGVAGLRNHQTRMDVVGNNVANVNTIGFKASRVNFQAMLSQTLSGASAGNNARGGTNPMQVGLGMSVASIGTNFDASSLQSTGLYTDVALTGPGFFVVGETNAQGGMNQYFTRAGNFTFDNQGYYGVPGSGMKVLGWNADADGVIDTTLSDPTAIQITADKENMPAKATTELNFKGNVSSDDPIAQQTAREIYDSLGIAHKVNSNIFRVDDSTWLVKFSLNDAISTATSTAAITVTGGWQEVTFDNYGKFQGAKTLSTPPSTSAGATAITIPNLQLDLNAKAHSQCYTYLDSNNDPMSYKVTYTNTGTSTSPYTWTYSVLRTGVSGETASTGTVVWDTAASTYNFTPPLVMGTVTATITAFTAPVADRFVATATPMAYSASGTLDPVTFTFAGGKAQPLSINLKYGSVTQYGGDTSFAAGDQNGYEAGARESMSISQDGTIVGSYSNGQLRNLGQIAVANFTNPGGLEKVNETMYTKSSNSGPALVGTVGQNGTKTIQGSALEMSSVDMSTEFSDMIVTQRGFQANSKIITTTDEMLELLANLKR
ncbi:MAG TPA: flagellar hook-basal body complex protein [Patescibacteria group bacterium]|nr:flagellar hook-basal body complex protein [Patescibacteria group bacterium]